MNRPLSPQRRRGFGRPGRRAFTLMEMLLVLTIIALLGGLVIYQLTGVAESAKRQKAQADMLGFRELMAAYELDSGSLPTTEQGLKALWEKPTAEPVPKRWRPHLPQETLDPWNHPYQFANPGKHHPESFDVWSMGPDGQNETKDDIGNWPSADE